MKNIFVEKSFGYLVCALSSKDCLPLITIYKRPLDMPEREYVARLWRVTKNGQRNATAFIAVADTLKEIRKFIPSGMACFARSPEDEPHIVECWI